MKGVTADPIGYQEVEGPVWTDLREIADPMAEYLSKEEYLTLLEISQIITSSLDLEEILDQSLQQLAKVVEASASSIWLINESTQRLYVATATGIKRELVKTIHLDVGQGIVGQAVETGQSFITADARGEKYHAKEIADMLEYEATTLICVPMRSRDRIIGAIQALNKAASRVFNHKDMFLLSEFADLTGLALENGRLYDQIHQENSELRRKVGAHRLEFRDIITDSLVMKEVLDFAAQAATTNSTVLLLGESGTGKELVAQGIHNTSPRKNKPFVPVNCAAFPAELLESELFGHEKGAFTGAISRKEGWFEIANDGSLFLDEIGDMPTSLQAKLLRVLQDRTFNRVGGTNRITCDVRIVAATNQDLESKMKAGTFREDLYYRLNVIPIALPSLRERVEDIPILAEHFLIKYSSETKRKKSGFTPEAMQMLMNYPWPGNVRELANAIEHAVVLGKSEEIKPGDLPASLRHTREDITIDYSTSLEDAQRQFKKQHILRALRQTGGNRSQAAKRLKIQRTYLSRLIKELEIDI